MEQAEAGVTQAVSFGDFTYQRQEPSGHEARASVPTRGSRARRRSSIWLRVPNSNSVRRTAEG